MSSQDSNLGSLIQLPIRLPLDHETFAEIEAKILQHFNLKYDLFIWDETKKIPFKWLKIHRYSSKLRFQDSFQMIKNTQVLIKIEILTFYSTFI